MYRAESDVSRVLSNVTPNCAPVEKPWAYPKLPLKLFETSQFDVPVIRGLYSAVL